jgi:hypothetical protein
VRLTLYLRHSIHFAIFADGADVNGIITIEFGSAFDVKTFGGGIIEPFIIAVHGVYLEFVYFPVEKINDVEVLHQYGNNMDRADKLEPFFF